MEMIMAASSSFFQETHNAFAVLFDFNNAHDAFAVRLRKSQSQIKTHSYEWAGFGKLGHATRLDSDAKAPVSKSKRGGEAGHERPG
jgi:hypothetical protein